MKKLIMILTCLMLFTICTPVYGAEQVELLETEYFADGSYFETVITAESNGYMAILNSKKTVTKTKTSYYKNSSGTTLWYVKVTGTFTYGNGSSKCTSSAVTAASKSGAWKITSKSASKSGNKATAKATAKRYYDGSVVETKYKTVTLTCSPSGNFS